MRQFRAAFVAAVLVPAAAGAQTRDGVFELGTVEVIGERESAAAQFAVERVDAETMQALHTRDLSEALDLLPGVTLENVGQRRERLVSVRGFSSRQVPLFIDGVPVYVPYDGNVDLSRFGIDYVSEIIVSKGLASVLYGPNILGGAINVVSRRPTAPLETSFEVGAEMGERGDSLRSRVSGSVGGISGNWYAHLTASHVDSEGYSLADDFEPTPAQPDRKRRNADSRDTVISAKLGYVAGRGDEYALSYYRQDGEKNVPPYAGTAPGVQARFWQWPFWDKESFYFTARNGIGGAGTLRWRLYHDSFSNSLSSFDDETYSSFTRPYAFEGSVYDDYTFGGNADFEWSWSAAHATRTAVHWKQDVHREVDDVDSPEERYEDRSWAFAVEHEWRVTPALTLTPGYAYTVQQGRRAENFDGSEILLFEVGRADGDNAQLVAAWSATPTGALIAGVSRKTRFPTIKDRFSFRMGAAIPNENLGPETAQHYELGWTEKRERWDLRVALFQADIDDAIENVIIDADLCTSPNPTCFQQRNIGEQRNRGAELALGWRPLDTLRLDVQVSLLDRDNRTSPDIRPLSTPERKYRLAARWQPVAGWTLKADAQHESERYSTTDGARVADDFTLVHAFVRYEPVPRIGIEAGARNLTDELYAYQEGFFEPGRTWLAQIDYRY
ncbi:TonB-dependent receptor plug domain-containing protein [Sinimarinibacterium flocculans]|uniref:Iron complex outermembrane receptor protein n=1 Tax=Sinimarinibacterium flocculans TaxID=985250 RepID=A0A318E9L1_9GAMM|nr:TonB-dependent receptor [Sinimarinibacterium flocculans]PXV65699.1 iron complex outermembrane receptor protein [Sinimarinibacterium flocculans]